MKRLNCIRRLSSNTFDCINSRNMVFQTTNPDALRKHLESSQTIYTGFDPTAKSLHVGNLLTIIGLLHFQMGGHQAIALVGGATGSIGDPSGKSTERIAMDSKQTLQYSNSITTQLQTVFENSRLYARERGYEIKNPVKIVNNIDWFKDIPLLEFINLVGRAFRVNSMIAKDSVKSRLNANDGISYSEFSYQLFQAFDFWHLYRHHQCSIQLGGSDQWGNITAGLDLIKKKEPTSKETETESNAFAITIPLVTTADGKKFGKSEGNAIWLNPDLLSVFEFYQVIQ